METKNNNSEKLAKLRNTKPVKINDFGEISSTSNESIPDPFQSLRDRNSGTLSEMIEAIVYWYQKKFGNDNFVEAHDEFQKQTGRFLFGEQFYNERMSYFLDYFAFLRPCKNSGADKTPYQNFISSDYLSQSGLSESLIKAFQDLESHFHSAYEIYKVGKKTIVRDIFKNTKIEIDGQGKDFFDIFQKGSIFQGFIFNTNGSTNISNGIVIHNKDATRIIKKNLKKSNTKSPDEQTKFVFNMADQNTNFNRMRNLAIKSAYTESN